MIKELTSLLNRFPGVANRVRCFLHIINLIARAILKQFDLPKKKSKDAMETDIERLAGDIENEEIETRRGMNGNQDADDQGNFNPRDGMTAEEEQELDEDVHPVRLMLVKVSSIVLSQHLTHSRHDSSADLPMRSRIRRPVSYHDGSRSSMT
jgi:hypothetical protein